MCVCICVSAALYHTITSFSEGRWLQNCIRRCFNMGHNGHGINLYVVVIILMGNLHAGGQSSLGHLSLVHL